MFITNLEYTYLHKACSLYLMNLKISIVRKFSETVPNARCIFNKFWFNFDLHLHKTELLHGIITVLNNKTHESKWRVIRGS